MRPDLAGRVLDRLLEWNDDERRATLEALDALAQIKYDEYEAFRAGGRFLESLARWLAQMPSVEMRRRWISFVLTKLVYINSRESEAAISTVYYDVIRPRVLKMAADRLQIPPYHSARIAGTSLFKELHRKLLIMGLSDGARLDRLRRASPHLSHEQFWLTPELSPSARDRMQGKLAKALSCDVTSARFEHVLLVDDFYGTGTSLIDHVDGKLDGRITRILEHMTQLQQPQDQSPPLLVSDCAATIILYVASERAVDHIHNHLAKAGLGGWDVAVVQRLGTITDELLLSDCDWFFDPILTDEHKGAAKRGYKDAALPLVLTHNTPNNSVSPLWADSSASMDENALYRRALFPRFERHHADRP